MSNLSKYFNDCFNPKRPSTFVVSVKSNKNGMLTELIELTSFLDEKYSEISVNQRLYHFINNVSTVKYCKYCGLPLIVKPYNARLVGSFYQGTCGNAKCRKKLNVEQTELGVLKKYGVSNISKTKEWHDKVKATNLKNRGVEWNTQSPDFIRTTIESNNINRDNINRKRKIAYANNSLKKYGVSHPRQDASVFRKSHGNWFKKKSYRLPSGKIIEIQGYEGFALDILLKKFNESDLIVNDSDIQKLTGKIMYEHNDKTRRYYPDIYIIPENKIVEVKSKYTYTKDLEINNLKMKACIDLGFSFEFMIIEKSANSK